jgi:hypothetical protein
MMAMDKKMQLQGYFILFLNSNSLLEDFCFPIIRSSLGKGSEDKGNMDVNEEDEALGWVVGRNTEFIVYDFMEVLEATDNFSEENKLGQG